MHRSGSSALASLLSNCNVNFGNILKQKSYDNPAGYFENELIVALNEKILKYLDRTWDEIEPLEEHWHNNKLAENFKSEAKSIIIKEYAKSNIIGIKDPRMSLLMPFWENILSEMKFDINFIISYRHPYQVTQSLLKRNYFNQEKSYLLYCLYNLHADINSRSKPRVFVSFNELITNTQGVIDLINQKFDTNLKSGNNNIIDIKLRHYDNFDFIGASKYEIFAKQLYEQFNVSDKHPRLDSTVLLDSYVNLSEQYVSEYKVNANSYIKVLWADSGLNYNEKKSFSKKISSDHLEWCIEFDKVSTKEITIKVANHPIAIEIENLTAFSENEESEFNLKTNADYQSGNYLLFRGDHPDIILGFNEEVKLVKLKIVFKYIFDFHKKDLMPHAENSVSLLSRVALWLKYPFRLISNINLKNYRTLKSALRRESPREILRNFGKLLNQKESQSTLLRKQGKANIDFFQKREIIAGNSKISDGIPSIEKKYQKKILYIVTYLPEFDSSAGGKRATRLLSSLTQSCKVYVYAIHPHKPEYRHYLEELGINIIETQDQKKIVLEVSKFDVLIYAWYYTFYDAANIRRIFPKAITIIDTVDIHWVREFRNLSSLGDLTTKRAEKNKAREISAYKDADIVWAVTEPDKRAVLSELPDADVRVVALVEQLMIEQKGVFSSPTILFIGSYTHHPNIAAVRILSESIFPKIREAIPEARLIIAGANASAEIVSLSENEGIDFIGFVEESQIKELYEKTALVIVPLLSGAGMKGKVTEAVSYSVPVITNSIGNEGIDLRHLESGFITDDFDEMAVFAIGILKNKYNIDSITKKAQEILHKLTSPENVSLRALKSFYPEVSICIVSWNAITLLKNCIDSIITNTKYPNYKILIHSNGCTDGTLAYVDDLETEDDRIEAYYSTSNEFFVGPNNKLMQQRPKSDIVLVNNDVKVEENWLLALNKAAYENEQIGVVGSKILYPDGRLQEFGSEIYEDGTGRNIGKNDFEVNRSEYSHVRAVGYVSGCSMYIKRTTIDSIGNLSEDMKPMYYEDSDYCYRAWLNDLITVVTPDSIVYHYEGATSGNDESTGMKQYQAINRVKFLKTHSHHLISTSAKVKKANKQLFSNL